MIDSRKTIRLNARSGDTVRLVKEYFERKYGIPVQDQRLELNSKSLEDDRTLSYYGIKTGVEFQIHKAICQ